MSRGKSIAMHAVTYIAIQKKEKTMCLIKEQLKSEINIYNSLKQTGRDDYLAKSVLDKLEKEITNLQGQYDKKVNRGQKIDNSRPTSRFICYVKKAIRRNWTQLRSYYKTIFTVSKN
jgi:hypothetical protein